ncbi:unnamed protein product [Effrenium voratum]|nr:unnamed protein product [Effrenium voratum]
MCNDNQNGFVLPIARGSTLPLRLESLRYGADLVWGEEIIDRKIIGAVRVENPAFGIVDYVSPREKVAVFSTCAEESSKVIFQLGTPSADLAVQAAMTVCQDVSGIDINMGCPKSFSVKGGMGAALLEDPQRASEILKGLRQALPAGKSLTCKIRMLATTARTRDFMQAMELSGAEAITVHLRQRDWRPVQPACWEEIVRLRDAVKVPVLANGDFFNRRQIDEFWKHCGSAGVNGVMIARGALWNPSIFCKDREVAFEDMARSYLRSAVACNSSYQNTKWVLSQMLEGGTGVTVPTSFQGVNMKTFNRELSASKSMAGLCSAFGEVYEAKYPARAHTTVFYKDFAFPQVDEAQPELDVAPDGADEPPAKCRKLDSES